MCDIGVSLPKDDDLTQIPPPKESHQGCNSKSWKTYGGYEGL